MRQYPLDMRYHPLELLSPAKDLACGIAAIDHGADAVYIGAQSFGARAAASNSLSDIEQLVRYAHLFRARVYVTLNTLLNDSELEKAVQLAHQLYELGADALIIQDMGFLECDMPPIPLHASTQCNNRIPEKVKFLEEVGFSQAVLARELSLQDIRTIREATALPLECFVHGALCVSYSGQCYISEIASGRSGNRGECAQYCRHAYDLYDGTGTKLKENRYLLSIKDLDLSAHLFDLIEAGISSFKIEGRLKDINYVKNVTAFYRKRLDELLKQHSNLQPSSSSHCQFSFTPVTSKSFNRGKTDYFLNKKRNAIGTPYSPKSLGEELGRVVWAEKNSFRIDSTQVVNNGDGLCYLDATDQLVGIKANRVEGDRIYHREKNSPTPGTLLYRNYDTAFIKKLKQSKKCRFISLKGDIKETQEGLCCTLTDEDKISSTTSLPVVKQVAKKPGVMLGIIEKQMKKSGGTLFIMDEVTTHVDDNLFLPVASINELRRKSFENHLQQRQNSYTRPKIERTPNNTPWISPTVTLYDNVTNAKSRSFYQRHGVQQFTTQENSEWKQSMPALMTTRYCIKYQCNLCPKVKGAGKVPEPLTLSDKTGSYTLSFDCKRCEMTLRKE